MVLIRLEDEYDDRDGAMPWGGGNKCWNVFSKVEMNIGKDYLGSCQEDLQMV